jgi:hypothetical protein
MSKTSQLQIRVSPADKARIQARAAKAGMDVSKWVLHQLLPPAEERFQSLCLDLGDASGKRSYVFAELNDFLARLGARELVQAVRHAPSIDLSAFEANYLAAMVEQASTAIGVSPPDWVRRVKPLEQPWFASSLKNLRLHLLTASPAPVVRQAAARMAADLGLDDSWPNDAVKGYLSTNADFNDYLELPNLGVLTASAEYLLAMRCLAMRLGEEFQDEQDVRFLLRYLNITRHEAAVEVVARYYPIERVPQKTLHALEEILGEGG